jgi:hypothetical protein
MSRLCLRREVVLPLTAMRGDVNDQVGEPESASGANLRVPAKVLDEQTKSVTKLRTVEFRLVNPTDGQFGASNRIWCYK